jgi:predicted DNA-binding transcriptional regulator AlpA
MGEVKATTIQQTTTGRTISPENAPTADTLTDSQPIKALLGIKSERAFWRQVHDSGIPHYALNKRVIRFRVSEVEQWLTERRKGDI